MGIFEDKLLDLKRKGAEDKWRFLENLDKLILPSQKKRIQQNDKTIIRELVLPSWLSWELLFDWAIQGMEKEGKKVCLFCHGLNEGINFKGKHVCWGCFNEMKSVQGTQ
jgi:hypothetical protein